jgi:hypothetical protein
MNLDDLVRDYDEDERAAHVAAMLNEARRRVRRHEAAEPRIARTEKRCPSCKEVRAAEEFGRNAARPDGLQSICRACRGAAREE